MSDRFENGRCGVVVAMGSTCHFVELESDTAITLIATLSDDPENWHDVQLLWSRYKTPVVPDDLVQVQLTSIDSTKCGILLSEYNEWMYIDLDQKRLITSEPLGVNGSNCVFDLFEDESEQKGWPVSIHLPPWWQIQPSGTLDVMRSTRPPTLVKLEVDRDVLFGKPLIGFLVDRLADHITKPFLESEIAQGTKKLYALTVQIHRDWLMTPRDDLGGRSPRQFLHGGRDWLERVSYGQSLRALAGLPLVAFPRNHSGYEASPMGCEEVILYFDLCRHLIDVGWVMCRSWLKKRGMVTSLTGFKSELSQVLSRAKSRWLNEPLEDGACPQFILDCSRGRVPRSPNFAIEGIQGRQPQYPLIDCDCVVCQMMASGKFGPGFESLDGHHLELDEDFAFSMFETMEEWQEEQALLGATFNNEFNSKTIDDQTVGKVDRQEPNPVFAKTVDSASTEID